MDPSVREGNTFLEVYNCDIEKPPRKNTMPAEKQVSNENINRFTNNLIECFRMILLIKHYF